MTINVLKLIDHSIEKYVKHYKEDWYTYDRPRAAECKGRYIVGYRDTGTHILFIDDENFISDDNVYVFRYFAETTQKKFMLVDNTPHKETIKNIRRETALKWCEKVETLLARIKEQENMIA